MFFRVIALASFHKSRFFWKKVHPRTYKLSPSKTLFRTPGVRNPSNNSRVALGNCFLPLNWAWITWNACATNLLTDNIKHGCCEGSSVWSACFSQNSYAKSVCSVNETRSVLVNGKKTEFTLGFVHIIYIPTACEMQTLTSPPTPGISGILR